MTLPCVHVIELDTVESTHKWALENAERLVVEGALSPCSLVCVNATVQTAGIGQPGKVWLFAERNLVLTFLTLCPTEEFFEISALLPLTVALAVVTAVKAVTAIPPSLSLGIKWMNDITCGDKKLGGVLCEGVSASARTGHTAIAMSVGLNLHTAPDLSRLEESQQQPVTCLAAECVLTEQEQLRSRIIAGLSRQVQVRLRELRTEKHLSDEELKSVLVGVGRKVRLESEGQSEIGEFCGVCAKTGGVILRQGGSRLVTKGRMGGSLHFL